MQPSADGNQKARPLRYLANYLSSMRRIFIVMVAFGLAIGLVIPLVVDPFVIWKDGQKTYFQLACLVAGFAVGTFCYLLIRITLFQQKGELERAKDRFTSLTEATIKHQQQDVILEGEGLPTCWQMKDCNDGYSLGDSERVTAVTRLLAECIGLDGEKTETLMLATMLHDIGKIGVPSDILTAPEKLSPEEMERVRKHPEVAQQILHEAIAIKDLVSAILYHHERWDGTGYPEQLTGEDIPLFARIVSITNAYRAMLSDRPYRKAIGMKQAIAELRKNAGKQFDPDLMDKFAAIVEHSDNPRIHKAG